MKRMQLVVMAAAMLLMAGTAMAAGSATLNVTASVLGTCTMAGPGTLNFGVLDPAVAGASATANSAGITITCSNGTPYTVTTASANGGLLMAGANSFPYSLTLPGGGSGIGTGVAGAAYTVAGNIAAGAFFGKVADVYTDTVTLNITP